MAEDIFFVAIGCGRLPGMVALAQRRLFIVLGTMDGQVLAGIGSRREEGRREVRVYFYESG